MARRSAASRPVAWFYQRIQQPVDLFVLRLTGGRATPTSVLADVRLVILTTRGARTGVPRVTPVLAVPYGDGTVVLASNYGRRHHPAWYYNLRSDPRADIIVDGVSRTVRSRELSGVERDEAFSRAVEIYPGFERYRRWAAPRVIPVIKLERDA